MRKAAKLSLVLFAAFGLLTSEKTQAITIEAGDFVNEIERLRDLAFGTGSNLYVAPTQGERSDFAAAATSLLAGNAAQAEAFANPLGYDVVQFTDNGTNQVYLGLREQLVNNAQTKGWGSYFLTQGATSQALVEVPHPIFDTNSWDIGAQAFEQSGAVGFLMAGAHRNSNGAGTADVAHLADSMFQEVHIAWNGNTGQRTAWQIHGFNLANYGSFPPGTDAVLSNGDGGVSPEVIDLDSRIDGGNFLSHAYNTLAVNDPTNQLVNGNVVGTTFSPLGGTTNVQGIHSRGLGGTFVHVELEQSIRFDSANRDAAATLLAEAIAVPEPQTVALAFASLALLAGFVLWRRRFTGAASQ